MAQPPTGVVDEDGNVYLLETPALGHGAQGAVYRTSTAHVAVKLLTGGAERPDPPRQPGGSAERLWTRLTEARRGERAGDSDAERQALRRRLEDVRLLPLPDLHLAQPLSLLADQVGYTMRLLTGMVPVRTLIAPPGTKDVAAFYQETGGLGRRLDLLAEAARLLSRVHGVPLVYADLSLNNVFVSEDLEARELWLIDLDNLDFLSRSGRSIHTPGFGAPEVVRGGGVTTLSDAWAFAVLAFWMLAQVHPFLGDYVEEGGWDADEDREKQAFAGELPWIDDPADDLNRTAAGLRREMVLSRPLRGLFERTFGPGRADPTARPGLVEWAEVLLRAADRLVRCACGAGFDVMAGECPFCRPGCRPSFLYLQVNRWDPEFDEEEKHAVSEKPVWHKLLNASGEDTIARHVVEPLGVEDPDLPVLRVRSVPAGIAIEPLAGAPEIRVVTGGRMLLLERELRLPIPTAGKEVYLHFGPSNRSHRLGVLRWYGP
jgi:hypothetical protein